MWKILPLKDADDTLVEIEIKDGEIKYSYPSCKLHGAMNKITKDGIWRCVSTYRQEPDKLNKQGRLSPGKFTENDCKAGCIIEG